MPLTLGTPYRCRLGSAVCGLVGMISRRVSIQPYIVLILAIVSQQSGLTRAIAGEETRIHTTRLFCLLLVMHTLRIAHLCHYYTRNIVYMSRALIRAHGVPLHDHAHLLHILSPNTTKSCLDFCQTLLHIIMNMASIRTCTVIYRTS